MSISFNCASCSHNLFCCQSFISDNSFIISCCFSFVNYFLVFLKFYFFMIFRCFRTTAVILSNTFLFVNNFFNFVVTNLSTPLSPYQQLLIYYHCVLQNASIFLNSLFYTKSMLNSDNSHAFCYPYAFYLQPNL